MNAPLVSVVVPAYNHGRYLPECIDSVLGQTYPQIELIVLDDGSTDNTRDVLKSYAGRIHWETQPNCGQSATLNRGWSMSTGDLLTYLSADDVLYPDAISRAVAALQAQPDIVVVYPDFDLIDAHSHPLRRITAPEFDARDLYLRLVCQPGPGALFRRSAWQKAGPWKAEFRQNPDLDFWMRMALHGNFRRIPDALAAFRVHRDSQTYRQADPMRAEEPTRIVRQFLELTDLPVWLLQDAPRMRAAGHIACAQLHLHAGRWREAMQHARAAWSLSHPTVLDRHSLHMMGSALFGRSLYRLRSIIAGQHI